MARMMIALVLLVAMGGCVITTTKEKDTINDERAAPNSLRTPSNGPQAS